MPETKVVQILFSSDFSLSHPWQMYYSINVLTSNIVSIHTETLFSKARLGTNLLKGGRNGAQ